jgi:hypothetical protein
MCVFLCANPNVREWLEMPQGLAYRQALQLCALCSTIGSSEAQLRECHSKPSASFELEEAARRRIMLRFSLLQTDCRYRMHLADHGNNRAECGPSFALPNEWHKALEALAKTWGRLLSLVGLRW